MSNAIFTWKNNAKPQANSHCPPDIDDATPSAEKVTVTEKMAQRLLNHFRQRISSSLQHPKNDAFGWITKTMFLKLNKHLELNAVKMCNIKPDHRVLEIGFGPGLGLQATHNIVKKGKGKVYGIDTSFYMVDLARKRVRQGVSDKKVVLFHGSASNIPLNTDSIDRVYHCNSYYFWPNMRVVMREIYRVMKPGAVMVTTMNIGSLKKRLKEGVLTESQIDPVKYMTCLENYGFEGVRLEYKKDESTGLPFEVIFAEIGEKPAHHADMLSDDDDDDDDNEDEIMKDKTVGKTGENIHIIK